MNTQQLTVLSALVSGLSITKAAEQADLDRSTIHRWLKSDPEFSAALAEARANLYAEIQDQIRTLAATACNTLQHLLTDPGTPASVRLKAALEILKYQTTPLPLPAAAPVTAEPEPEPEPDTQALAEDLAQTLPTLTTLESAPAPAKITVVKQGIKFVARAEGTELTAWSYSPNGARNRLQQLLTQQKAA